MSCISQKELATAGVACARALAGILAWRCWASPEKSQVRLSTLRCTDYFTGAAVNRSSAHFRMPRPDTRDERSNKGIKYGLPSHLMPVAERDRLLRW